MNSPSATSSPTYKNLKFKHKCSPIEIKEQLRKNYKDKVKNCRHLLMNKFRGQVEETDLRNTLLDIFKSLSELPNNILTDDDEHELREEIQKELVQEELQWWLQEYERSQLENIDWSLVEQDDNVICPVCQKTNFTLNNDTLSCPNCRLIVRTNKSLSDIKSTVVNSVEKHNTLCASDAQFTIVPELNESHIYLICDSCMEMHAIV